MCGVLCDCVGTNSTSQNVNESDVLKLQFFHTKPLISMRHGENFLQKLEISNSVM